VVARHRAGRGLGAAAGQRDIAQVQHLPGNEVGPDMPSCAFLEFAVHDRRGLSSFTTQTQVLYVTTTTTSLNKADYYLL
jgi:hypothetical protein